MGIKRKFFVKNDNLIIDSTETKDLIENYKFLNPNKMIIHSGPGAAVDLEDWRNRLESKFTFDTEIANHDFIFQFAEEAKDKNSTEQTFVTPFYKLNSEFNYNTDYFDEINGVNEKNLVSFYLSYKGKQNERYENLFAIPSTKKIDKELFSNFFYNYFDDYRLQSERNANRIANTVFGTDYALTKNYNKLEDFPVYNHLSFTFGRDMSMFKNKFDKDNMLEHVICNILHTSFINSNVFISETDLINIRFLPFMSVINNFKDYTNEKLMLTSKNTNNLSKLNFINKSLMTTSIMKLGGHTRTFQEIFEKKESKKEMIFFRVDKYVGRVAGRPIQSYYIPATNRSINLLDSQVYHDKQYHYVVNAYVLVYGTAYSYSIDQVYTEPRSDIYKAEISVNTRPDFRVYEVELFRTSGTVTETPPNKPFILFVNNSDQSNKITLSLKQPMNKTEQMFETIDDADSLQAAMMKTNAANTQKFKFENKKSQISYQIYRMAEKPKKYMDFRNALLEEVETEVKENSLITMDHILPNKKYYYIARAVSTTGKVSSPSVVYEVELKKDSGESTLDVKTIDLKMHDSLKKTVSFKKLMYLAPADDQNYLDPEDARIAEADSYDSLFETLVPGDGLDRQTWNRKFKFRLKSKTTGKIIDFNIKFKLKKVRNLEDLN